MAAALIQFIAPRWWEEEKVSKLLASTHYEGEQQMRLIGNRLKHTMLCQHAAEKFEVQARSRKKRDN